ncbi:MAG: hypothetical protein LBI56_02730 [Puniceicoccales bacterium]|jgi:hypothetical protein|nr:hypothetical protein [Puniceicoccales bacterium]
MGLKIEKHEGTTTVNGYTNAKAEVSENVSSPKDGPSLKDVLNENALLVDPSNNLKDLNSVPPNSLFDLKSSSNSSGNSSTSFSSAGVENASSFLDEMQSSLVELMSTVLAMMYEMQTERRGALGQSRIIFQATALQVAIKAYDLAVYSAKKSKNAAELDAWHSFANSVADAAKSAIELGMLQRNPTKATDQKSKAAGNTSNNATPEPDQAAQQKLLQMASALSGLIGNALHAVTLPLSLMAVENRYRADMSRAAVDLLRELLNLTNSAVQTSGDSLRDAHSNLLKTANELRQIIDMWWNTINTSARNI